MLPIKVAAGVLNQTPIDWPKNEQNIINAIYAAKEQQVAILCLPELCISGYGCEDVFHSRGLHQKSLEVLLKILPATKGIIAAVGLPLNFRNGLFNTSALLVDGTIAGFVAKQFLAGDGIHYENRWFKAWPPSMQSEIVIDGKTIPIGDLFFDCNGIKIGFEICEDAWVGNRSGSRLAAQGIDLILNPSASHFAFGKNEIRKRYVLEGSRAFNTSYIYSNLLGNEAGRAIYDGGGLIASAGNIVASGERLSFRDFQITAATIDVDLTRLNQTRIISYQPDLTSSKQCVSVDFSIPQAELKSPISFEPESANAMSKEEEFARSVSLALFDYMRKSRSRGFVISLSGGADSAATACLASLAFDLAEQELSFTGVLEKLDYLWKKSEIKNGAALKKRLITCVYQATKNNSDTTRNAAAGLAKALGATFYEFNIDAMVEDYTRTVSEALQRELTWAEDDLALQNIQARVRAPGVWLLANINNALLLSTSNRSEAAVGYATMDGDTSGGLAPIAGIDKNYLRHWLRWLEMQNLPGLAPISALKAINVQQPTAELRPQTEKQTDEADLMPYPVLDTIERAAIRDKRTPLDAFKLLELHYPEFNEAQLLVWTERFFRLWSRNQWKRERYAPSFHVDDENLDPKTWCRFPILSGGFEAELEEVRAYVKNRKNKES